MADPRPLWEVMAEACAEHTDGIVDLKPGVIAAMIRVLRDHVAPRERTLDPIWHGTVVESEYDWRQHLRALLTAEAHRAERGE